MRDAASAVAVVLVLVAASVAAGVLPVADGDGASAAAAPADGTNASVASVAAGQREAVNASLERARFEGALEAADSDAERAAVVARHLNRSLDRLDRLERAVSELERRREAGAVGGHEYAIRRSELHARAGGLQSFAADLRAAAERLSADERRAAGVTTERLDRLENGSTAVAERTEPAGATPRFGAGFYATVERLVARYNANVGGRGGGFLGDRLAGERVTLVVSDGDASTAVAFRIDGNGRIVDLRAGRHPNPTLVMRTDRATVERLADAPDPVAALQQAIRDDDIRLQGVGLLNRVKWGAVDLASGLLG